VRPCSGARRRGSSFDRGLALAFGSREEGTFQCRLTDEEEAVIDLKLALARAVREERSKRKLTQNQLGRLLGSSQSRIAKMEAGDPSVSIDLLVRSLFRMGASRRDLIRWLARPARKAA
jgi:DNA-binding XRE family transcriptional regulator